MEICQLKIYIQKYSLLLAFIEKMAAWLKRLTLNPLGSICVGSNPIFDVFFNWFYGVMDSNWQFEFSNLRLNLGKFCYFKNLSHHLL